MWLTPTCSDSHEKETTSMLYLCCTPSATCSAPCILATALIGTIVQAGLLGYG